MNTPDAFHTFFKGLIDYAGLFPPAKLPLEVALQNYSSYLNDSDSQFLASFILPTSRISELREGLLAQFSREYPLTLSLITRAPTEDMIAVKEFIDSQHGRVLVGALEIPIAQDAGWNTQLSENQKAIDHFKQELPVFYELAADSTGDSGWDEKLPQFIDALSTYVQDGNTSIGFKLRCGGVKPEMVPSVERVATAILAAAQSELRMKFTAGLHHPLRHFSEAVGTDMHGYLNVFYGAMIAGDQKISHQQLCSILLESHNQEIRNEGGNLSWLGYTLSHQALAALREHSVLSYGSCSFTEPLEDARKLGWLV